MDWMLPIALNDFSIRRMSRSLACAAFRILLSLSVLLASLELSALEFSPSSQSVYDVPLHQSRVFSFNQDISQVSVGDPGIADFVLLDSHRIHVVSRFPGTTNLILWDRAGRTIASLSIQVTQDVEGLKALLNKVMPGERISVSATHKSIVLSGPVSSQTRLQAALDVAKGFLQQAQSSGGGGQAGQVGQPAGQSGASDCTVNNLLWVSDNLQVMLEVKVAEIARSVLKNMRIDFHTFGPGGKFSGGAVNGGANFPDFVDENNLRHAATSGGSLIGPAIDEFAPDSLSIDAAGLFLSYLSGGWILNATINAGKNQGLIKILAEPTLTAQSGQEAKFLAGGEFPIPVLQGGGGLNSGITIDFKEFGVGLKFVPVVLGSDRINLNMNVSVSELSDRNRVIVGSLFTQSQFFIPSLTKRAASSTISLRDGQTMALAGLISDNLRENVDKFPVLGDVPVLGALFRSQDFVKDQSELVILVTPHLAKPIDPSRISLPTDSFVEPDDFDYYMLGKLEARDRTSPAQSLPDDKPEPDSSRGGIDGEFGHQLPE